MGRSTMLNAAASSAGYDAYQPKSVQQGPGKRGERELSYNSGRDAMNKKLNQTAAPKSTPTAVWFIAGALIMGMLYMFNAFSAQAQQPFPPCVPLR